jgi:hypothetical protein
VEKIDSDSNSSASLSPPMGNTGTGKDAPTAQRARALREALGYTTSNAFAAFLGIGYQRWNHVENGHPLAREIALLLVQKVPGLTLDWLYLGRTEGLPIALARALGVFDTPQATGNSSKTSA